MLAYFSLSVYQYKRSFLFFKRSNIYRRHFYHIGQTDNYLFIYLLQKKFGHGTWKSNRFNQFVLLENK